MNSLNPRCALALASALTFAMSAGLADGATLYRCGPDGSSYSQTPCPDGVVLSLSDSRDAAQRAHAQAVAAGQSLLLQRLEAERRQREAAARLAAGREPAGIKPLPVPAAPEPVKGKAASRPGQAEPSGARTSAAAAPSSRRAPG